MDKIKKYQSILLAAVTLINSVLLVVLLITLTNISTEVSPFISSVNEKLKVFDNLNSIPNLIPVISKIESQLNTISEFKNYFYEANTNVTNQLNDISNSLTKFQNDLTHFVNTFG